MKRKVVIIGGGGLTRELLDALATVPGAPEVIGILDDSPATHGRTIASIDVLGSTDLIGGFDNDVGVVVCTGSARDVTSRRRIVERLHLGPDRFTTVVHAGAHVGRSCRVGNGSVLLAGVVATADVVIGAHVVLMPNVVLTHDDVLEDYVTVAAGARLAGGVRVMTGAYIGAGALLREGVTVGVGAVVGMGAVVLGDVPAGGVWVGNPAKPLTRDASGQ